MISSLSSYFPSSSSSTTSYSLTSSSSLLYCAIFLNSFSALLPYPTLLLLPFLPLLFIFSSSLLLFFFSSSLPLFILSSSSLLPLIFQTNYLYFISLPLVPPHIIHSFIWSYNLFFASFLFLLIILIPCTL